LGDDIQFLDNADETIWQQLRRGEILEVEAVVRRAGFEKLFELIAAFEEMLPIIEKIGGDATVDPELGFRTSRHVGSPGCLSVEEFFQGGRDQPRWQKLGGQ